jgi:glutamine amidotransferase
MIVIVNYGLGNIKAFANIYKKLNIACSIASTADELRSATKIILPGVGAFDHAMEQLDSSGMRDILDQLVLVQKVPVLGICVGMQMLAHSSDEGQLQGLKWIDAEVKKFDASTLPHKTHLPHMGWNDVRPVKLSNLFIGLERDAIFYFLHSYYFKCNQQDDIAAVTDYGTAFSCAIQRNNVYGVQFHPEKSHHYGIQLLKNFATL